MWYESITHVIWFSPDKDVNITWEGSQEYSYNTCDYIWIDSMQEIYPKENMDRTNKGCKEQESYNTVG